MADAGSYRSSATWDLCEADVLAIHFKCEREGIGFRRLSRIEGNIFRTCCWDISEAEAKSLVGGWVYLHPTTKKDPSAFGGKVLRYEMVHAEEGYEGRVALIFEARSEARKCIWHGQDHGMAWTGRCVPADLPHERV